MLRKHYTLQSPHNRRAGDTKEARKLIELDLILTCSRQELRFGARLEGVEVEEDDNDSFRMK
jgi:hypothetical protein